MMFSELFWMINSQIRPHPSWLSDSMIRSQQLTAHLTVRLSVNNKIYFNLFTTKSCFTALDDLDYMHFFIGLLLWYFYGVFEAWKPQSPWRLIAWKRITSTIHLLCFIREIQSQVWNDVMVSKYWQNFFCELSLIQCMFFRPQWLSHFFYFFVFISSATFFVPYTIFLSTLLCSLPTFFHSHLSLSLYLSISLLHSLFVFITSSVSWWLIWHNRC